MDIFKQIVFRARLAEDRPALATIDGVVSFRAIIKATEAAAQALATLPLDNSTLVAIEVNNQFNHVALLLALGLLGVPSASIQTRRAVEASGVAPAFLLTDQPPGAMGDTRVVQVSDLWFASDVSAPPDYAALLALPGFCNGDDIVRVAFSSGTTGIPKAVAARRDVFYRRTTNALVVVGWERALISFGFSVFGGYQACLQQLVRGALLVLANNVKDTLQLIRVFEVTSTTAPTVLVIAMAKELRGHTPLTSLKSLGCAGSNFPPELIREAQINICPNVLLAYATTEVGGIAAAAGDLLRSHPGSVGFVLPSVDLQVVDKDHNPLPAGSEGIIRVRTDDMLEYLNPSEDTEELFHDGWFYPGDVGRMAADGALYVVGRSSEVINRSGTIVAPEYVETVLRRLPDIGEIVVFGMPAADGQEEIWAALETESWFDETLLRNAVSDTLRGNTPVRFVGIPALPRTSTGKVQRGALRQHFTNEKGGSAI